MQGWRLVGNSVSDATKITPSALGNLVRVTVKGKGEGVRARARVKSTLRAARCLSLAPHFQTSLSLTFILTFTLAPTCLSTYAVQRAAPPCLAPRSAARRSQTEVRVRVWVRVRVRVEGEVEGEGGGGA